MIPKNITKRDILKAIAEVNKRGIPQNRHSTKWSLIYDDQLYPPKYLISLANKFRNGLEWSPKKFSGGYESNQFLEERGFEIAPSGSRQKGYPLKSHSWIVISESVAIKEMDKSSFLHHGTAIPQDIRTFF